MQGLRYWVLQPLVVRDAGVAAEAAIGLSGASSRFGCSHIPTSDGGHQQWHLDLLVLYGLHVGRCTSSLSSSPSTASLTGSLLSSGAASPGEGERAGAPHLSSPDGEDATPQPLLNGGMAAATVVSPVSLAAQTLRRLVQPHRRLHLNVRIHHGSILQRVEVPGSV